jgi:iron uptake system component EfeO
VVRFRRPVRRDGAVISLASALVLALAACGGAAPGSAAPAVTLPPGAIAVEANEYAFTPAVVTIPAGTVTFAVRNSGTENHEFEVVAGEAPLGKLDSFARGTTEALTVTLAAGEYTLICRLNGHDQLGMKAKLTVTGG